jgi:hypothetical protein
MELRLLRSAIVKRIRRKFKTCKATKNWFLVLCTLVFAVNEVIASPPAGRDVYRYDAHIRFRSFGSETETRRLVERTTGYAPNGARQLICELAAINMSLRWSEKLMYFDLNVTLSVQASIASNAKLRNELGSSYFVRSEVIASPKRGEMFIGTTPT